MSEVPNPTPGTPKAHHDPGALSCDDSDGVIVALRAGSPADPEGGQRDHSRASSRPRCRVYSVASRAVVRHGPFVASGPAGRSPCTIMARLLVVHHTTSPHLQAMFEAVVSGATHESIEGVTVVARPALAATAIEVMEGAAVVGVGLGGVTAWHNGDGSQPSRVGQAADQASEVGQADAGTSADSSQLKATHRGASCTTSHAGVPASEPDSDPPGPPPPHSQLHKPLSRFSEIEGSSSRFEQVADEEIAAMARLGRKVCRARVASSQPVQ